MLVARGGDGGMLSNRYIGQKGDVLTITLDLKVISDIGFVGYVVSGSFMYVFLLQKIMTVCVFLAVAETIRNLFRQYTVTFSGW